MALSLSALSAKKVEIKTSIFETEKFYVDAEPIEFFTFLDSDMKTTKEYLERIADKSHPTVQSHFADATTIYLPMETSVRFYSKTRPPIHYFYSIGTAVVDDEILPEGIRGLPEKLLRITVKPNKRDMFLKLSFDINRFQDLSDVLQAVVEQIRLEDHAFGYLPGIHHMYVQFNFDCENPNNIKNITVLYRVSGSRSYGYLTKEGAK